MYTNFTIQTNRNKDQKNEAHSKWPDYIIRTKTGDTYTDIGVAWKKVDKANRTYLSCKMDNGFFIEGDKIPYNAQGELSEIVKPEDWGIDPDEIPF